MKIVTITHDDTKPLRKDAERERVTFDHNQHAHWFGIYDNGELVSCYCLVLKGKTARFKSNYTIPSHRHKGMMHRFINHAKHLCRQKGFKTMTAFCTPMSANGHIENGAQVQSTKNDITFLKYRL